MVTPGVGFGLLMEGQSFTMDLPVPGGGVSIGGRMRLVLILTTEIPPVKRSLPEMCGREVLPGAGVSLWVGMEFRLECAFGEVLLVQELKSHPTESNRFEVLLEPTEIHIPTVSTPSSHFKKSLGPDASLFFLIVMRSRFLDLVFLGGDDVAFRGLVDWRLLEIARHSDWRQSDYYCPPEKKIEILTMKCGEQSSGELGSRHFGDNENHGLLRGASPHLRASNAFVTVVCDDRARAVVDEKDLIF
ncbi:hypothetical protein DY000_02039050 [Brassica cretica]|uniref:Uncharacterized protein n=1 Tax=Brassica cretica TaxID=69181 RepID=A0ABQ7BN23_BRACR|nr:hypothetical protein DY000_02039050 [Brassica cretica]